MTEAHTVIESVTLPLADRLVQAISDDEALRQWAILSGWETVDKQVVARQAALNLVLRALVCHCLSAHELPVTLSPDFIVTRSNTLLQSLGISPHPSSFLDQLAIQGCVSLQEPHIAALAHILQGEHSDVIGNIYASWIPQDLRRPLGQFWTPLPIAQLMTQWAIRSPDDRVLDPAFGSGIFLLTAIEHLKNLGAPISEASRCVSGVEVHPLIFLIGLINVLLRYPRARPRLQWNDFLIPERSPLMISKEPTASYEVQGHQLPLPGLGTVAPRAFPEQFDAIVCNPPYTRHHRLPEAYKSAWTEVARREYGIRLSRFSSLFAYFFIQARRMLSPTGRMAFITPATVFEASYSSQVKAFILRQLRPRAIISFSEAFSVFEGVDTAACITLVEGPRTPAKDRIIHVRLHKWPGVESVLEAIEYDGRMTADWGSSCELALSTLEPHRKWTVVGHERHQFDNELFVPLSKIAHIMRGIATGANDFFVLSDEEVVQWGLDRANLRPVLTKTREASRYVFSQADFDRLGREGKKRWLLYLTEPVTPSTAEAHYVQYGESRGLQLRSLVKARSPWYVMEQRAPAPIYYTYLSRRRSRFILNQANVLALNVFLCIYPIPVISQDETMLKALLAALNAPITKDALRQVGRTYGSDTIKVEPREMDQLPVLNPVNLAAHKRQRLAELFDQLCCADSEEAQRAVRQAIDETIATISTTGRHDSI